MTNELNPQPDRIDELMVAAVTEGLSPQDAAELSAAIAADKALRDEAEAYELAAAAIDLALDKTTSLEDLPASLREKLLAEAAQHMSGHSGQDASPALKLSGSEKDVPGKTAGQDDGFSWTDGRAFGWYAAAAAVLALCVMLMQPNQPGGTTNPDPIKTAAELYNELYAADGTVVAAWGFAGGDANDAYADAGGEVIYNTDTQTGYMKLNGMPINNPTELQYQLWIVDGTRSGSETTDRIDGGVFDVTAKGEVIIPIDAKIVARQPAVFAITAETPGGVVVSKGPLQVVAVVESDG